MFVLCVAFIALPIYAVKKYKDKKVILGYHKLGEFFVGLKRPKITKLFTVMLLIRKLAFVCLIVFANKRGTTYIIAAMFGIQMVYMVLLRYLRPFKEQRANLIE